jgi:glycosyltransferase involved in cell wall biosynthesis
MNTNRAKEKIQELFPMIPEHRFSVLYNGFDNEDFEHKKQIRKDDKIIFTYTGGFYGQRTPAFFLQAMKELNQEGFLLRNLLIRFVGNYVHARKEEILSYQISDNIDIISQVSHDESIEYLMDSDFLLLFIAKEKSEIVIPAKLFEYIAAKKPILAMVPLQGEAAELIVSLGTGLLAEIDDVSLIKSHILELCQLAKEQKINSRFHFSTDSIFQFERKIQTKSLAEIFNVTGK